MAAKAAEKDIRSSLSTPLPEKNEEQSGSGEIGGDTMKVLIDEANRTLKSLQETDPREKTLGTKVSEAKMFQLRRQLDEMKKISLRPFRLSKIGHYHVNGLLDSGARHPLRPRRKGEKVDHYPKVQVTLAGDQQVTMSLPPTGVIIGDESGEPIMPMDILATSLNCTITWNG